MTNFIESILGEQLTFQRGFDITKAQQVPGEVLVYSSSGPNSTHNEYKIPGPGVIIGRKGSLGTVFYSARPYWPHDTTLWVKDFHGNDPKFAYYFLQTMHFERYDAGASNPTLNRNHIHLLPVRFPPLPTQRRIASILSAYDDLIENNTRRIAILEEMAQSLYREWFVHFRYPGHEHVPLVASPLGPVPEGWEVKQLGQLATESRRSTTPDEISPETPYVGLEHIPRRSIALSEWGQASSIQSTKLRFRKGEILFGKIRPYFHKVAVAPLDGVCSTDAIVISALDPVLYALVLSCVFSEAFVDYATQTSQGTKMPRANWNVLVKYDVAVPPCQLLARFNEIIQDVVAEIKCLVMKTRNLRSTRDLLLPKLIAGEVRTNCELDEEL